MKQSLRELAEEVLAQRRTVATDLIESVVIYDKGSIGFRVAIPYPGDKNRFVGSSPVVKVADATRALLEEAFDEGLNVCRDKADEIAATP